MSKSAALKVFGPLAIIVLVALSARSASADKCGAIVVYDLELESLRPSGAEFPGGEPRDWPAEWPQSLRFETVPGGNGYDIVFDESHAIHVPGY